MLVVVEDEVQIELLVHGNQRIHAVVVTIFALKDKLLFSRRLHGVLQDQLVVIMDDQIDQRVLRVLDIENQLMAIGIALIGRIVLGFLQILGLVVLRKNAHRAATEH